MNIFKANCTTDEKITPFAEWDTWSSWQCAHDCLNSTLVHRRRACKTYVAGYYCDLDERGVGSIEKVPCDLHCVKRKFLKKIFFIKLKLRIFNKIKSGVFGVNGHNVLKRVIKVDVRGIESVKDTVENVFVNILIRNFVFINLRIVWTNTEKTNAHL